jgi:hypothetical protein
LHRYNASGNDDDSTQLGKSGKAVHVTEINTIRANCNGRMVPVKSPSSFRELPNGNAQPKADENIRVLEDAGLKLG